MSRRTSKLGAGDWRFCRKYWNQRCCYCGEPERRGLTNDHYIPKRLDGINAPWNVVPACIKCNRSKGSKHPDEWCTSAQRKAIKLYFLLYRMPNTLRVLKE
jgi:hypothetical protein